MIAMQNSAGDDSCDDNVDVDDNNCNGDPENYLQR